MRSARASTRELPYDPLQGHRADRAAVALAAGAGRQSEARREDDPAADRLRESAPRQFSFASSGPGSITHLTAERFKRDTGIELLHVPYKGGAPATAALVSGEGGMYFACISAAIPHVKAGRLTLLGITSPKRSPLYPDTPAVAEAIPGFEMGCNTGFFAPAGTPPKLLERLHAEVMKAVGAAADEGNPRRQLRRAGALHAGRVQAVRDEGNEGLGRRSCARRTSRSTSSVQDPAEALRSARGNICAGVGSNPHERLAQSRRHRRDRRGAALRRGHATAKLLLGPVSPWLLAGLLYLGSGAGLALLRALRRPVAVRLARGEAKWLAAAILAGGVAAPVLLMWGLARLPASTASLLLNAEGVFTALLAWFVFRENFDRRIALGMGLIVAGAIVLSAPGGDALGAGLPAAAVLLACFFWGLDNNFTRKVALADATFIAMLKGLAAGLVNVSIAVALGATFPQPQLLLAAGALGFVSYGLSLVLFVVALRHLGTARTGAYFSTAPFVGALIAVRLLDESVTVALVIGGALMAAGVWLHLTERHEHRHTHEPLEHEPRARPRRAPCARACRVRERSAHALASSRTPDPLAPALSRRASPARALRSQAVRNSVSLDLMRARGADIDPPQRPAGWVNPKSVPSAANARPPNPMSQCSLFTSRMTCFFN